MTECDSYETHKIYPTLNDQQQFRLNKIKEIKDYFIARTKERELMNKRLTILISNNCLICSNCYHFY